MKPWPFILTLMLFLGGELRAELGILVSTESSFESIDVKTARRFFSGRQQNIGEERKTPVFFEGSKGFPELLDELVQRSEKQLKNTWKKLVFTGKASMPKFFGRWQDLKDHLLENPTALACIDSSDLPEELPDGLGWFPLGD